MKDNLNKVGHMDLGNIFIIKEQVMMVNGLKIDNMEKEKKYTKMDLFTKVSFIMGKSMEKEWWDGLQVKFIKVNLMRIK